MNMLTPLEEYIPYFTSVPMLGVNPYSQFENVPQYASPNFHHNIQNPNFNQGFHFYHSYSVKAYSGASRKLPDFRVDSILDKPVKVDEVSTSTLSAASNSRKLASSQRASSRKKTAVPSQPRPLSPPRVTRSRRSKVSSSGKFLKL